MWFFRKIIFSFIFFSYCMILAEPTQVFTVPKKKSSNTIKQEITETLSAITRECAQTIAQINTVQQSCMNSLSDIFDSAGKNFFTKASREQLLVYQQQLNVFEKELKTSIVHLKNRFTDVKNALK